MTVAVLTRQNRMLRLAEHHAHLDLQVNLMTEHKVSKILQLFHESQRPSAATAGQSDTDVGALTAPADAAAILQAVKRNLGATPG